MNRVSQNEVTGKFRKGVFLDSRIYQFMTLKKHEMSEQMVWGD